MCKSLLDKFFSLFCKDYIEKVEIISDVSKLLTNIEELVELENRNKAIDVLIEILQSHKI